MRIIISHFFVIQTTIKDASNTFLHSFLSLFFFFLFYLFKYPYSKNFPLTQFLPPQGYFHLK